MEELKRLLVDDLIYKKDEEMKKCLSINDLEQSYDSVSNPAHYTEGREYEPRRVIEDWGLGFNLGNAIKYISRAGRKGNAIEDLNKAIQYIRFEIERLEEEGERQRLSKRSYKTEQLLKEIKEDPIAMEILQGHYGNRQEDDQNE